MTKVTMMDKVPDRRLEPKQEKTEVANFCSVCGEPILVGETYLPIPNWGWVCEYCAKERSIAE